MCLTPSGCFLVSYGYITEVSNLTLSHNILQVRPVSHIQPATHKSYPKDKAAKQELLNLYSALC